MNKTIIPILTLVLCVSCSSLDNKTDVSHIAYCPEPLYKGIHVSRIEINTKGISPGQTINLTKDESKKVEVVFFVGNGFSSPLFLRGSLIYDMKISDGWIRNMHPLWTGQLSYTRLMPAPIMNDKRRFFCNCRTLKVEGTFDLSDSMENFDGGPFSEYMLSMKLRYYLLNQGNDEERSERFEVPIKIKIKDTELKDVGDSATASPPNP